MQKNSITPTPVNKIKIVLTKKKMTAHGGFALIAAFLRQIGFAQMLEYALPIIESSPNGMQSSFLYLPASVFTPPRLIPTALQLDLSEQW